MTRINLDFVALHTADLDAARQYYTGVLGFGLAASSPPNAAVFQSSGGTSLAVRLPQPHEPQHPPFGAGVSVWFGVPDAATVPSATRRERRGRADSAEAQSLRQHVQRPDARRSHPHLPRGLALTITLNYLSFVVSELERSLAFLPHPGPADCRRRAPERSGPTGRPRGDHGERAEDRLGNRDPGASSLCRLDGSARRTGETRRGLRGQHARRGGRGLSAPASRRIHRQSAALRRFLGPALRHRDRPGRQQRGPFRLAGKASALPPPPALPRPESPSAAPGPPRPGPPASAHFPPSRAPARSRVPGCAWG